MTGGITGVVYGEPRLTQDIDIVIKNEPAIRRMTNDLDLKELLDEVIAESDEIDG